MPKFKKFRTRHKIVFIVLGIIGLVNIWRGLWTLFDNTPLFSNPIVAIVVGFALIAILGVFYKIF